MKKKTTIIILVVILAIVSIIGAVLVFSKYSEKKQTQALQEYFSLINNRKYEDLYEKISSESQAKISKDDFVKRNQNIYEGIDAVEINISVLSRKSQNGKVALTYNETIPVSAGTINFENTTELVKESGEYKIVWSSSTIFPQLADDGKVRVATVRSQRGEILDRNNQKLAENQDETRLYPLGEAAAHLVGYVGSISEEELKQNEGKNYGTSSIIGKTGLEQEYEETLRGIDGKEIYIVDKDENKVAELAKVEPKDGTDIKTTIDVTLQSKVYEQMKNDRGLFVVMNPQTGEILSAVSTPSYNNNDFVVGISSEKWEELNNDEGRPLINKISQSYCPGSTFKPLTASIGLNTGKISTDTTFDYQGLEWQKDSSWGNDKLTTLTAYNAPKNVINALIYSDNIFFGRAAMQIGTETFIDGLKKMGFEEQLNLPLSAKKSQYSNTETIENEKKLADSGYGQGNVLVNPIHMASIYSAFANEGNMVKPYLVYNENEKAEEASTKYLKQNVISPEVANTVRDALIQVVENPKGTAHDMQMANHKIAGKTGTAELKTSADDTQSGTLGWFNCFTLDEAQENKLIISMVENTQNNTSGGSHYLIQKIRNIL